jgi:hypothetical protein
MLRVAGETEREPMQDAGFMMQVDNISTAGQVFFNNPQRATCNLQPPFPASCIMHRASTYFAF